jgi:hypothetical protein
MKEIAKTVAIILAVILADRYIGLTNRVIPAAHTGLPY